jgi:hypothetical protein
LKDRQRTKGKNLHIARISPIVSNLLKKIIKLIFTRQLQLLLAEPEHCKPSLLNDDISETEILVPLQEETPEKARVLCSPKYSDLQDTEFRHFQVSNCGLKKKVKIFARKSSK